MPDLFLEMLQRLVVVRCEDDNYNEDGDEAMSVVETQARSFDAGTIAPGGDIKVWMPVLNELCKWAVGEFEKDSKRQEFLDNYLLHIKYIIEHVLKLTAANLPGMYELLENFCMTEYGDEEDAKVTFVPMQSKGKQDVGKPGGWRVTQVCNPISSRSC